MTHNSDTEGLVIASIVSGGLLFILSTVTFIYKDTLHNYIRQKWIMPTLIGICAIGVIISNILLFNANSQNGQEVGTAGKGGGGGQRAVPTGPSTPAVISPTHPAAAGGGGAQQHHTRCKDHKNQKECTSADPSDYCQWNKDLGCGKYCVPSATNDCCYSVSQVDGHKVAHHTGPGDVDTCFNSGNNVCASVPLCGGQVGG